MCVPLQRYTVAYFSISDEVEVVLLCWINEDESSCRWPPYKDTYKITKAVKTNTEPSENWSSYAVRCLYYTGESQFRIAHNIRLDITGILMLALIIDMLVTCRSYTYMHSNFLILIGFYFFRDL